MTLSRRTALFSALGALLTGCSSANAAPPVPVAGGDAAGAVRSPAAAASGSAPADAPDPLPAGVVNALLVGTDSNGDASNTDVLVLAQLSADRGRATLVSVPRDCYVPINGAAPNKVNVALATTGVAGLRATVSDLFGGLPIACVARTNFATFVGLVGAFDGFSVQNRLASAVTSDVTHKTVEFPAGPLQLHGADWLIYARQRHGLPNGDFDRTERHRALVSGMIAHAKAVLTRDPARFASLVADAARNVRFDGTLTASNAFGLARALRALDPAQITSLRVATAGFGAPGLPDAALVDAPALAQLAAGLRAGDVRDYLRNHPAL